MPRFLLAFTLLFSISTFAQTQDSLVLQPGPLDGKDAIVWSITQILLEVGTKKLHSRPGLTEVTRRISAFT